MTHPVAERVERAAWWRDHLRQRCAGQPSAGDTSRPKGRKVLIAEVVRCVREFYGLGPDEMNSRSRRSGDAARARHVTFYLARTMTDRSLNEIARFLGGYDRSTIIYAVRKIESEIAADPELRADVDAISGAILNGWA